MSPRSTIPAASHGRTNVRLQELLLRLPKGGPEQQAIEAGEIDAIVDHASSNVILLPAARRARFAAVLGDESTAVDPTQKPAARSNSAPSGDTSSTSAFVI